MKLSGIDVWTAVVGLIEDNADDLNVKLSFYNLGKNIESVDVAGLFALVVLKDGNHFQMGLDDPSRSSAESKRTHRLKKSAGVSCDDNLLKALCIRIIQNYIKKS